MENKISTKGDHGSLDYTEYLGEKYVMLDILQLYIDSAISSDAIYECYRHTALTLKKTKNLAQQQKFLKEIIWLLKVSLEQI